MKLSEKVQKAADSLHPELVRIRRHFHKNPELSFEEYETARFICEKLDALGISYKKGIAGTGIVAEIKGETPGRTIALRADMDALPIQETAGRDYGSSKEGIMHACGHDVHMTSLLGAAMILNELRKEFKGTVRLIFQPGEELLPGGASLMIKENVLDGVDCIIGQHVYPSMETGLVGFREGMYMASTDELYVTVEGKGGHAAMPKEYNSPLIPLSEYILKVNELFMGKNNIVPEGVPTVVAFGKLNAEGATNVIPVKAFAEGTFRTMDEAWRKKVHSILHEEAAAISKKYNVNCGIEVRNGYPFLVNDIELTKKARGAAEDFLGRDNVEELPLRMTAEDFAWYTHVVPGCFYRLGTGNKEKGICSGVHTPSFDVDERSLVTGSGLMAYIALTLCGAAN